MPARLTLHPPQRASRFLVVRDGESLVIGRDPDCGLVIEDKRVSKRHAELRWTGSAWVLQDLGSKNGTSVNGISAEGQPLADVEWVSFGGIMGRFERVTEEQARSGEMERLARIETSVEMKRRLGEELEPLDLLLRFLESAMEVARAERGFVLVAGSDGRLRPEVTAGFSPEQMARDRFAGSAGAIERALQTEAAVVVSNAQADPVLGRRASVVAQGIGALACIPLRHEDRLLGLLYVDASRPGAGFTVLDVEILEALADHTAMLIAGLNLDRRIRGLLASHGAVAGTGAPTAGAFAEGTVPGKPRTLTQAFASMVTELKQTEELSRRERGVLRPGLRAEVPAPGTLFAGRYEILLHLGGGGMGTVYRALDRELDEEVALKVLTAGDPEVDRRLRQEIRLARMITHPNVVRTHDYGDSGRVCFLTMEYVPGRTLREILDEVGAQDLTPGLLVAKQICRGLAAVHKAGIVHGDLTPRNVMVTSSGLAKLMDFGLARSRRQHGSAEIAGTPHYMSPEQTRGADLDERSDLYSAGVLMYELFTGRPPFDASDALELLRMHQEEPPPDPRSLRPGLPDALVRIILDCLAKNRLERPGSAADLDRMLMRVRI